MAGQVKGIVCLLIAGAILAFTDGLSKYLTGGYPHGEIMFFRASFVFVPIAIMTWRRGGFASLRVVNWKGQLARGLSALITSFLFMVAVKHMPLADITPVTGQSAHPFFLAVAEETGFVPRWNFNKILLSPSGEVVGTWGSLTKPMSNAIRTAVEAQLKG